MTYSFDIFDTCIVRKCGTPENMLDVLSLRVFREPVDDVIRQEFVVARYRADMKCGRNSFATLKDIYDSFEWSHPLLLSKEQLLQTELECERMMLTPVLKVRDMINQFRLNGHHIIYISDMYLPEDFIREVMRTNGFLCEGDTLYVSCATGKRKSDGNLYEHILCTEKLNPRQWVHFGDNLHSDYRIPRQIGIKSKIIQHEYLPYENMWRNNDFSTSFKVGSIMAGMSRSIHLSQNDNTHQGIVLDIIAPFYNAFVCRVLKDAVSRKITRLYFCARDAYSLYLVARQYESIYNLKVEYLYISQKSLYEGDEDLRIRYFQQIGLATESEDIAIVDVRSTGHTIVALNEQLIRYGFKQVRGYYFEMFCSKHTIFRPTNYYAEVNNPYMSQNLTCNRLLTFWQLYEMFFSIHTQNRTIGYCKKNDIIEPLFEKNNARDIEGNGCGNGIVLNTEKWGEVHQNLLLQYTKSYIELGLYSYCDDIYHHLVIPTLVSFMEGPEKYYLHSLTDFMVYDKGEYKPYVKKQNIIQCCLNRGKNTIWKRGTLILSLPNFIIILYKFKHLSKKS